MTDINESGDRRKAALLSIEALNTLLKSQGWDMLRSIVEEQVKQLHNQILLHPLGGDNGVYEQEYNKGHAMGLQVVLKLPGVLLDQYDAVLKSLAPDEDEDIDGERTDD
jgi:hypothetical protein